MTKRRWRWLLLPLIAVMMLIVTACGKSGTSSLTTIKIGYMENANSVGLAAIADQAGYFKKQGFKVKLVAFADGPSILAAMKSGSIDVGNIGSGAHTALAQGAAKVIMIDGVSTADELIGNSAKGITKISDLKGKKVAVVAGTTSEMIFEAALKKAGMKTEDVTVVNMSANNIASAMASGKVDAAATWSPSTTTIKDKLGDNAVTLASDKDFASSMPFISSWVVTAKYEKANAARVVKITKALMAANDARAASISKVAPYIAKQLAITTKQAKAQMVGMETLYTSKQIKQMATSGKLAKLYDAQQQNFIKVGTLKDTGSLATASDYLLVDVIQKAAD
ncbi:ABC transporter substrate-binding protein [Lacticaseibacillus parakribbianus]|uniref:ABC transporter substrate-binding protein n=1 Tax=Lacticaseibacillus parakribbianus TaxID=2970927 RepID=UPI0021CB472C|nr:ABC transporter substrate-binding protein [Lacticaseibacillus parakribbianus]